MTEDKTGGPWKPVDPRFIDPKIQPYRQRHVGVGSDEANRKAERDHYDQEYRRVYGKDAPEGMFDDKRQD